VAGERSAELVSNDEPRRVHRCLARIRDPFARRWLAVAVTALDLSMPFADFDDYWLPHTFAGPAATHRYVATLDDARKNALCDHLRAARPIGPDDTIRLTGRAWAVRGTRTTA
jgi:hypothetical protein